MGRASQAIDLNTLRDHALPDAHIDPLRVFPLARLVVGRLRRWTPPRVREVLVEHRRVGIAHDTVEELVAVLLDRLRDSVGVLRSACMSRAMAWPDHFADREEPAVGKVREEPIADLN